MTFEGQDNGGRPSDDEIIGPEQELDIISDLQASRPKVNAVRQEVIEGLRQQGVDTSVLADESVFEAKAGSAPDKRLAFGSVVQIAAYAIHSVRSKIPPEGLTIDEETGKAMFGDWAYARLALDYEYNLDPNAKKVLSEILDESIRPHVPAIKPDRALDAFMEAQQRLRPHG